jgi:beta-phosphoglucomutase-like phosphatase (HAD superfamily)
MPPSAVLFAFDGVLADLENHHVTAWQRTLARLGWLVPDNEAARSAEVDDHVFAVEVFARRGIVQADVQGWVRRKRDLMRALVGHAPRLFPGAVELVEGLAGRARLAVVADAPRDLVEIVLDRFGLTDRIERIIAGDDYDGHVDRPRPDDFRRVLKQLKLASKNAVTVQGTADGLAAARASGVSPVAVGHRRPFGEWVGDARYISGFEPVSSVLTQLGFAEEP